MSYIKVWLHFVWSTKNRKPLLADDIRQNVFQHIRENAKEKEIFIDFINGYVDHAHCLISLGADQTLKQNLRSILEAAKLFQERDILFAVSKCIND